MVKQNMDDAIPEWEDDGGSSGIPKHGMIGTLNQIAWAVQIRSQVDAEFDRVRKVLEYAMTKSPMDIAEIESIIQILEEKRAAVMENERAGYFIHEWQELGNQVSRMVVRDPRYQAIKVSQATRRGLPAAHIDDPGTKTPGQ
jgi:hypothetical protein